MKNHYLQNMGITVWHLRDNSVSAPEMRVCILKNHVEKSVGFILTDSDDCVALSEQDHLLQKIAGALTDKMEWKTALPESLDGAEFIILLGNMTVPADFTGRLIQSYSLSELVENTEYKKALWRDMKLLKSLFG